MQNVTTVGSSWRCQVVVTARLDNQDDDLTSPIPFYQHQNQGRRSPWDVGDTSSQYLDGGHYHYQGSASGPRWTTSVNLLCPPTMEPHGRLRSELPVSNASTEPHSGVSHGGHDIVRLVPASHNLGLCTIGSASLTQQLKEISSDIEVTDAFWATVCKNGSLYPIGPFLSCPVCLSCL